MVYLNRHVMNLSIATEAAADLEWENEYGEKLFATTETAKVSSVFIL